MENIYVTYIFIYDRCLCPNGWLICSLIDLFIDWLFGWLINWLLIDWLNKSSSTRIMAGLNKSNHLDFSRVPEFPSLSVRALMAPWNRQTLFWRGGGGADASHLPNQGCDSSFSKPLSSSDWSQVFLSAAGKMVNQMVQTQSQGTFAGAPEASSWVYSLAFFCWVLFSTADMRRDYGLSCLYAAGNGPGTLPVSLEGI